jgi:hypothetical protein
MKEFESLHEVVGKTIARITHGPVSKDNDSVSVYLTPHEDEEEGGYSRDRRLGIDFESVSLSTPRRNKKDGRLKKKTIRTTRGGTIPRKWKSSTRRSMPRKSFSERRIKKVTIDSDDEEWSSTSMMQDPQVYLDDDDYDEAYAREYTEDAYSSQSE